jgi:hypothetical protein
LLLLLLLSLSGTTRSQETLITLEMAMAARSGVAAYVSSALMDTKACGGTLLELDESEYNIVELVQEGTMEAAVGVDADDADDAALEACLAVAGNAWQSVVAAKAAAAYLATTEHRLRHVMAIRRMLRLRLMRMDSALLVAGPEKRRGGGIPAMMLMECYKSKMSVVSCAS